MESLSNTFVFGLGMKVGIKRHELVFATLNLSANVVQIISCISTLFKS